MKILIIGCNQLQCVLRQTVRFHKILCITIAIRMRLQKGIWFRLVAGDAWRKVSQADPSGIGFPVTPPGMSRVWHPCHRKTGVRSAEDAAPVPPVNWCEIHRRQHMYCFRIYPYHKSSQRVHPSSLSVIPYAPPAFQGTEAFSLSPIP